MQPCLCLPLFSNYEIKPGTERDYIAVPAYKDSSVEAQMLTHPYLRVLPADPSFAAPLAELHGQGQPVQLPTCMNTMGYAWESPQAHAPSRPASTTNLRPVCAPQSAPVAPCCRVLWCQVDGSRPGRILGLQMRGERPVMKHCDEILKTIILQAVSLSLKFKDESLEVGVLRWLYSRQHFGPRVPQLHCEESARDMRGCKAAAELKFALAVAYLKALSRKSIYEGFVQLVIRALGISRLLVGQADGEADGRAAHSSSCAGRLGRLWLSLRIIYDLPCRRNCCPAMPHLSSDQMRPALGNLRRAQVITHSIGCLHRACLHVWATWKQFPQYRSLNWSMKPFSDVQCDCNTMWFIIMTIQLLLLSIMLTRLQGAASQAGTMMEFEKTLL
eukprot:504919-Pelagomonas_calceolata.AAC.2